MRPLHTRVRGGDCQIRFPRIDSGKSDHEIEVLIGQNNRMHCITVFGGSGFLGWRIVNRLAQAGFTPRVAARHPAVKRRQVIAGNVEQIRCDLRDPGTVVEAIEGADGVVNAVGLYVETGADRFDAVHVAGARLVAMQAAARNLPLVHVSGIGADSGSTSRYIRARGRGEEVVREAHPDAFILRPSALFGQGDAFLGGLMRMLRILPVVPLFGDGSTRLQPVHVDDVAAAVERLFARPCEDRIYELGGPRAYAYRELLEQIAAAMGRRRLLLPLPFVAWDLLATLVSVLPRPPLTRDQVELMRRDNLVGPDAAGFADLGLSPRPLEGELPWPGG